MNSQQRRERIRELLIEELQDNGALDNGDLVTYWMTLVATHAVEDDGDELGPVYRVLSTPEPTASQALGLVEWQRMWMQGQITAALMRSDD